MKSSRFTPLTDSELHASKQAEIAALIHELTNNSTHYSFSKLDTKLKYLARLRRDFPAIALILAPSLLVYPSAPLLTDFIL